MTLLTVYLQANSGVVFGARVVNLRLVTARSAFYPQQEKFCCRSSLSILYKNLMSWCIQIRVIWNIAWCRVFPQQLQFFNWLIYSITF